MRAAGSPWFAVVGCMMLLAGCASSVGAAQAVVLGGAVW